MLNRGVVSFFALLIAIVSVVLFAITARSIVMGSIAEVDGVFAMGGWLLTAFVFACRSADSAYLEPLSIVKGR